MNAHERAHDETPARQRGDRAALRDASARGRHACDVADDGAVWRESYAPGAFIATPTPAPVVLRHDGPNIGYVFSVTPHGVWYEAELVIECDDAQRDLIRPGRSVSTDALARSAGMTMVISASAGIVDAVAILADRERPWYPDAKIVSVCEVRWVRVPSSALLWREPLLTRGLRFQGRQPLRARHRSRGGSSPRWWPRAAATAADLLRDISPPSG